MKDAPTGYHILHRMHSLFAGDKCGIRLDTGPIRGVRFSNILRMTRALPAQTPHGWMILNSPSGRGRDVATACTARRHRAASGLSRLQKFFCSHAWAFPGHLGRSAAWQAAQRKSVSHRDIGFCHGIMRQRITASRHSLGVSSSEALHRIAAFP